MINKECERLRPVINHSSSRAECVHNLLVSYCFSCCTLDACSIPKCSYSGGAYLVSLVDLVAQVEHQTGICQYTYNEELGDGLVRWSQTMSANGKWFQLIGYVVTSLTACMHVLVPQEIMSQTSLGRYNHAPRMRVQKAENVNKALQFIKGSGVVLTNIGPEGEA